MDEPSFTSQELDEPTLRERLRDFGPFGVKDGLRVARDVAHSVSFMRKSGQQCPSLNPDSIYTLRDGRIIIRVDGKSPDEKMGWAKLESDSLELPESDSYGIGCVLLYAVTGFEPSELGLPGELRSQPLGGLPPIVARLIIALVRPEEEKRLHSAEEALMEIDSISAQLYQGPSVPSRSKRIVGGAIAAAVLGAFVLFRHPTSSQQVMTPAEVPTANGNATMGHSGIPMPPKATSFEGHLPEGGQGLWTIPNLDNDAALAVGVDGARRVWVVTLRNLYKFEGTDPSDQPWKWEGKIANSSGVFVDPFSNDGKRKAVFAAGSISSARVATLMADGQIVAWDSMGFPTPLKFPIPPKSGVDSFALTGYAAYIVSNGRMWVARGWDAAWKLAEDFPPGVVSFLMPTDAGEAVCVVGKEGWESRSGSWGLAWSRPDLGRINGFQKDVGRGFLLGTENGLEDLRRGFGNGMEARQLPGFDVTSVGMGTGGVEWASTRNSGVIARIGEDRIRFGNSAGVLSPIRRVLVDGRHRIWLLFENGGIAVAEESALLALPRTPD